MHVYNTLDTEALPYNELATAIYGNKIKVCTCLFVSSLNGIYSYISISVAMLA